MTPDQQPDSPTPETRIRNARDQGMVVRCVTARGDCLDFRAIDHVITDCWVRMTSDDPERGRVVPTEAVRNAALACDPDVDVIPERESLFSDGRGDDGV